MEKYVGREEKQFPITSSFFSLFCPRRNVCNPYDQNFYFSFTLKVSVKNKSLKDSLISFQIVGSTEIVGTLFVINIWASCDYCQYWVL